MRRALILMTSILKAMLRRSDLCIREDKTCSWMIKGKYNALIADEMEEEC